MGNLMASLSLVIYDSRIYVDFLCYHFSHLRPDLLVRAARHYEGAFQVQVRKAVNTARQVSEHVKFKYIHNILRPVFMRENKSPYKFQPPHRCTSPVCRGAERWDASFHEIKTKHKATNRVCVLELRWIKNIHFDFAWLWIIVCGFKNSLNMGTLFDVFAQFLCWQ